MSWETPKTNWHGYTDSDGNYIGDRFNVTDFNRIKNNILALKNLSASMYGNIELSPMGDDKTVSDYFYADEMNTIETNFNTINEHTYNLSYGDAPVYVDNGKTPDYNELNRLERAIADMYNRLSNEYNGRRKFEWNFGMKGDF